MFILPEQLLSATGCRVDYRRINAGVVALGESPAGRSREASLIPNYVRLKRRRNVTTVRFNHGTIHRVTSFELRVRSGTAHPAPSDLHSPFAEEVLGIMEELNQCVIVVFSSKRGKRTFFSRCVEGRRKINTCSAGPSPICYMRPLRKK